MAKIPKHQDPTFNNPVCGCGHRRTQHTFQGCIWEKQYGSKWVKCKCPKPSQKIK